MAVRVTATKSPAEPGWLEQYGQAPRRRRRQRRVRRALLPLALLAVLVAALVLIARAVEDQPWKPPSGAPAFTRCYFGETGQVAAWCARVRVPLDAAEPTGPTLSLHV